MALPRQSVREYVQACDALIQLGDLTDHEMQLVDEMLSRLSERLRNGRSNGDGG